MQIALGLELETSTFKLPGARKFQVWPATNIFLLSEYEFIITRYKKLRRTFTFEGNDFSLYFYYFALL